MEGVNRQADTFVENGRAIYMPCLAQSHSQHCIVLERSLC